MGLYDQFSSVLFLVIDGRYFAKSSKEGRSCEYPRYLGDYIREIRHILITNDADALADALIYLDSGNTSREHFREIWNWLTTPDGFGVVS
jgi:hypothetical protein